MLKLTGAALIVISATLWGVLKAEKMKKRLELINSIISGLALLENEITYGKRDIKNALLSIGDIEGIEMFKSAAGFMDKLGIKAGFMKARDECGIALLGTEKQALDALAENLGMTDSITQIKCIRHTKVLLESAKNDAISDYDKSGKLYKSAGLLGGIAVVIFLL